MSRPGGDSSKSPSPIEEKPIAAETDGKRKLSSDDRRRDDKKAKVDESLDIDTTDATRRNSSGDELSPMNLPSPALSPPVLSGEKRSASEAGLDDGEEEREKLKAAARDGRRFSIVDEGDARKFNLTTFGDLPSPVMQPAGFRGSRRLSAFGDNEHNSKPLSHWGRDYFIEVKREQATGKVRILLRSRRGEQKDPMEVMNAVSDYYASILRSLNIADPDDERGRKIRKHESYITFDDETMLHQWSKRAGVALKESGEKKIVVIGAGDVGNEAVRNLIEYHKKHKIRCEIVLLDRSDEFAEWRVSGMKHTKKEEYASVLSTNRLSDLVGADVIIMTAGIKAGVIGASSRGQALLYNIEPIAHYSEAIKQYASRDAKVIVLTNPVETTSRLIQEVSGLPPKNIFGSGVALDSLRYRTFLAQKLKEVGLAGTLEGIYVVGQHDKEGMIFLRQHITLNGDPIEDLVKQGSISKEDLKGIFDSVEERVRVEGLRVISGKDGKGASILPADAACKICTRLLYGGKSNPIAAAVYVGSDNEYGFTPCYLGLPLVISNNGISPVPLRDMLDNKQMTRLGEVSQVIAANETKVTQQTLDTSRRLNKMLQKTAKPSDLIKDLADTISCQTRDELVAQAVSINKIFKFSVAPHDQDFIQVHVADEYSNNAKIFLESFRDSINRTGMVHNWSKEDMSKSISQANIDGVNKSVLFVPNSEVMKLFVRDVHARANQEQRS